MNNIYETASDLHVRSSLVYAKSEDQVAYYDKKFTKPVNAADLEHMFHMGTVVIVDTEVEYKAVSMKIADSVVTLTYVKTDSGVTAATVKSKEAAK